MNMSPRSLLYLIACVVAGLVLPLAAHAAEYQVKTAGGETVQGEYLGTENGAVKLRGKYGVLQIAVKDIVSMKEIAAAAKPAPAAAEAPEEKEAPPDTPVKAAADTVVKPPAPPPEPPPKAASKTAPAQAQAPSAPGLTFPDVRAPDPVALATARAINFPAPEPTKSERQEIDRCMRNFADTNTAGRMKIIRTLQSYGRMVDPFVVAMFVAPEELSARVGLLQSLAVSGRPFTTPVFAEAYRTALASMQQVENGPAQLPPAYLSKRDRDRPMGRSELLKLAADNVLAIEGYASTAGGPFNALFLLDIYRKRYTSDQTQPLLLSPARDRARLAATAADASRTRSSWTKDDRIALAEVTFPLLFRDGDLQLFAKDFLTKLLPTGHPKWDADQGDWVEWWEKAKEKLR
jgi:hypothetical protein